MIPAGRVRDSGYYELRVSRSDYHVFIVQELYPNPVRVSSQP